MVTPLGESPEAVFNAVREGRSALRVYENGVLGVNAPLCASLFEREEGLFQRIARQAARQALRQAGVDPASPRTGLVLSTVKGEIDLLGKEDVSPAASARKLADALGIVTAPVVVSNACISGLAALLQGQRMLESGACDQVLVVGVETQGRFNASGFQSLKALSEQPCKPFDAARCGLNLGEAAAAMVLEMPGQAGHDVKGKAGDGGEWQIVGGAVRNDANHISGPSRTGEGSYRALRCILPMVDKEDLAFVGVHGTATLYNDEMESIALDRAGLLDVPVSALKGTFGHTMGAAGILESILGMMACDAGVVLPSRGYETCGVSRPVKISASEMPASGKAFIKLLSGFGGVNAAMLFEKGGAR